MRNIYKVFGALALAFAVSSCNLDLRPYSVIDPENALETYADAEKLANGFNTQIRSLAVGSEVSVPEIQTDLFHATTDFGNRGGYIYQWTFTAGASEFESLWLGCYTAIANANYFIEKAASVEARVASDADFAEKWSDAELEALKGHVSEAYFIRAYAEWLLVDRYCGAYDAATADAADSGIPVVTAYRPTSDKEKYPSRSTLKASYDQIYDDLTEAEKNVGVLRDPAAGSNGITVDAVKALRARVALARGDYEQAIKDANAVIGAGPYSLVGTAEDLTKLWVNDAALSECIMQSYVALSTEMPGSNSYNYIGLNYEKQTYSPDYIPEQWLVDLYDEKDYRKAIFFKSVPLSLSGTESNPVNIFTKFPGNPALQTAASDLNYCHAPKPFRLAELYLIAAEAYAKSGSADGVKNASDLLNDLKAKRIADWEDVSYTANNINAEIQNERVRELVGEGFRLSDLKRYGQGMKRTSAQDANTILFPGSSTTELLSADKANYRFVWPIPVAETDANPKIKQNPGYTNN